MPHYEINNPNITTCSGVVGSWICAVLTRAQPFPLRLFTSASGRLFPIFGTPFPFWMLFKVCFFDLVKQYTDMILGLQLEQRRQIETKIRQMFEGQPTNTADLPSIPSNAIYTKKAHQQNLHQVDNRLEEGSGWFPERYEHYGTNIHDEEHSRGSS